jgi:hypothetical protein
VDVVVVGVPLVPLVFVVDDVEEELLSPRLLLCAVAPTLFSATAVFSEEGACA